MDIRDLPFVLADPYYNVTEGGTGVGTRDDFIFTTDSKRAAITRDAALSGANIATAVANATENSTGSAGNVTWTFSFALFEATDGNGNPNNDADFELLDASDNIVGTLDIDVALFKKIASHPVNEFFRIDNTDRIQVDVGGTFFTISDFTVVGGFDLADGTRLRLQGNQGIDPHALVALNVVPEPTSALLLSVALATGCIRRRR